MPIHVTTSTTQSLSNKTFIGPLSATGVVYASGGNSDEWNQTSANVNDTLYSNFYSAYDTIQGFISNEWYAGIIKKSATVTLTTGAVYMLASSDGSNPNDYIGINLNPITPFVSSSLSNFGVVNSFALSSYNACKYIIQVKDNVTNETQYSELIILSDGAAAEVCEYGLVFTAANPLIEYGAIVNAATVQLTAFATTGSMSNKVFKGVKVNFFNL